VATNTTRRKSAALNKLCAAIVRSENTEETSMEMRNNHSTMRDGGDNKRPPTATDASRSFGEFRSKWKRQQPMDQMLVWASQSLNRTKINLKT
jgi:hypothetical protein